MTEDPDREEESMQRQIPWWTLVPAILFAAVIGWTVRPVIDPDDQSIEIALSETGARLVIKSSRAAPLSPESLLGQLFATTAGGAGVLSVLREAYDVYRIDDTRLVEALQDLCESIPPDARLGEVIKIQKACAEKAVIDELRRLAQEHERPFHYVCELVRVGVQHEDGHRPPPGKANVCRDGPFVGRLLKVTDPISEREIDVSATGVYDCTLPVHPKIQLNPDDAAELYARALGKYEEAIVTVP